MTPLPPELLAMHIARLSQEYHVPYVAPASLRGRVVLPIPAQDGAVYKYGDVKIAFFPPVVDWKTYIVAMHEFGHVLGADQEHGRVTPYGVFLAEVGAWVWAKDHSLYWTTAMQDLAASCLQSYAAHWKLNVYQRAALSAKYNIIRPYPPAEHEFWSWSRINYAEYVR